jgi:hypothetical protein
LPHCIKVHDLKKKKKKKKRKFGCLPTPLNKDQILRSKEMSLQMTDLGELGDTEEPEVVTSENAQRVKGLINESAAQQDDSESQGDSQVVPPMNLQNGQGDEEDKEENIIVLDSSVNDSSRAEFSGRSLAKKASSVFGYGFVYSEV